MPVDTVIRDGDVVFHDEVVTTSVAIDGEQIVAIGHHSDLPEAHREVDASEMIVMPGVVDPHVHIDEVPENRAGNYTSETRAAARGGVTTLIDFAWQGGDRRIQENKTLIDGINTKIDYQDKSLVDYGVHGVLLRETEETLDQISTAVDLGVTSFKMFKSNYEIGVSNGFINAAFEEIGNNDAVALLHAEDPSICEWFTQKRKDEKRGSPPDYPDTRPDYSESMAVNSALQMAENTDVKYYGVHTTCEKAVNEIASRQEDRSQIRAETCTHYTALTKPVYEQGKWEPLIAPPIREESDVKSIFNHLDNGTLSVVSTDHSAYTGEAKYADNWWDSPFGANSLQRSLPVFHTEAVVNRGFSYPFLLSVMCRNPAQTFGMPDKGTLTPGTDADIVIFDPTESSTISSANNESNALFSIYEGKEVTGAVKKTFVRGELVYAEDEIRADPGHGQFLERSLPDWSDQDI